ncbi:hypothetical protein [Streptomyces sp. NPDC088915]|uniref:hypothetical protein n=1 Tax=Streptomyces sp. NPDC088915 TaxID=3365912 RepID=UPI0037FCCE19
MKHDFQVFTKAGSVASAPKDAAIKAYERVGQLSERAMGKRLPVPERFFRGFGPEAGPLKPTQVGRTGS